MSEEEEGSSLEFMADQLFLEEESQDVRQSVSDKEEESSEEEMEMTGEVKRNHKKKSKEGQEEIVKKENIKDEFIEES